MVTQIPPELLGLPPRLNPGAPLPAPTAGPDQMAGMVMGQLAPSAPLLTGQSTPIDPAFSLGDPVLAQMSANPVLAPFDPLLGQPDEQKPGWMPKLDHGTWLEIANIDQEHYAELTRRFSRD